MTMTMSENGRKKLAEWEGVRLTTYRDVAGYLTIGVGHLLTKDELSSGKIWIAGAPIRYADGLTDRQALNLLAQELKGFEGAVNRGVIVPLPQNRFDALVSFSYNVGAGAFQKSTLLKLLNEGKDDQVPIQLRRWVYAGGEKRSGLIHRRENEIKLWNAPPVPHTNLPSKIEESPLS